MGILRRILTLLFLLLFLGNFKAQNNGKDMPSINPMAMSETELGGILQNQGVRDSLKRAELIEINKALLSKKTKDSVLVNKTLAILYSENKNAKASAEHLRNYIRYTRDLSILNDHVFSDIRNNTYYKALIKTYKPHYNFLAIIHALTGIIGIFMVAMLFAKKNLDRTSVLLIGCFVVFHSLFMLHVSMFISNYNLKFPHLFYASTPFSFLYGPLLYFYYKRVVQNYSLKLKDTLHLIPTIILIVWLVPYFLLSESQKFNLQFESTQSVLESTRTLVLLKILSLVCYAIAIYNVFKTKRPKGLANKPEIKSRIKWERNIMAIFVGYAIVYILHGSVVVKLIQYEPFLYLKSFFMIAMIFYIVVMSGLRPDIIMNANVNSNAKLPLKYEKSNLTPSLSNELKEELIKLFKQDKIFRNNNISLEMLSDSLGTTRHNTSQVINEHFDMSFYDLVNHFRIMEAIDIFEKDGKRNLNIIDVAYEVGYNNKVTFNKAFKKRIGKTPSDFIRSVSLV